MPSSEDIIIDGGNKGKGDELVAYLKKHRVDDIEMLISTHPDADHIGGLDEVLDAFKVKSVYAPKVKHTTQAYKDFLLAVKREKLTIKTAGVSLPVKGVKAQFIGPVKDYAKCYLNNWSAVLHDAYKKNTLLFTGDAHSARAQGIGEKIKSFFWSEAKGRARGKHYTKDLKKSSYWTFHEDEILYLEKK